MNSQLDARKRRVSAQSRRAQRGAVFVEFEDIEDETMKGIIAAVFAALLLGACQQTSTGVSQQANAVSSTGPAQGRLTKSPVGTRYQNHYVDDQGLDVYDTYQVQPDHTVRLVNRNVVAGNS